MNKDHTLLLELFDQALHSHNMTILEKMDLVVLFRKTLDAIAIPPPAPCAVWVVIDQWGGRVTVWSAMAALQLVCNQTDYMLVIRQPEKGNSSSYTCVDKWKSLREWIDSHPNQ